jgi:hypothetical protein
MYFIWDRHIWRSYNQPELGLAHPYSGPHPHRDHVHFSFSAAGAAGRTSYWKLANTAIRPTGTQTAIAVRGYSSADALRWFAADEDGETAAKTSFGVRLDGNTPVAGDWDGDGTATEGLAWRSGKRLLWFLKPTKGAKPGVAFAFGEAGDVPVVGDWDGDGRVTVGVVRKDAGRLLWLLTNDNRSVAARFYYGKEHNTPVVGDWDGDGRATAGAVAVDRQDRLHWALGDNAARHATAVDVIEKAKAEAEAAAAKADATTRGAKKARRNVHEDHPHIKQEGTTAGARVRQESGVPGHRRGRSADRALSSGTSPCQLFSSCQGRKPSR